MPSIGSVLCGFLPLAGSSAIFACQITQQYALNSFTAPTFPTIALPAAMGAWISKFHNVAIFKTMCFAITVIFSAIKAIGASGTPKMLWWAGLALTIGHTYSISRAWKFIKLSEEDWQKLLPVETLGMVHEFLNFNKERLYIVDAPALLCILAAMVVEAIESK